MPAPDTQPDVEFFLFYNDAPPPKPASDTINGSLPVRARQYCPPVASASGFGWYLFPPVDFALRWDGQDTELAMLEDGEPSGWRSLAGGRELFLADGVERFGELPDDRRADLSGLMDPEGIPFANADPRAQNLVELHFGLMVRTSPGWSSLVRSVPNWPYGGFQVLDGILETDWYRSWVPVMVRLADPGRTVRFFRHIPVAALQTVPRAAYDPATMAASTVVTGPANFPDDVWDDHVEIRGERHRHEKPGSYKRELRRRSACPFLNLDAELTDSEVSIDIDDSDRATLAG